MLLLTKNQLDELFNIVERAYPEEGCGALLGHRDGDRSVVEEVVSLDNSSGDDKTVRYEIDSRDLFGLLKRERETDQKILGFFHSHPNHPAMPSQTDIQNSWPGYCYVIVSVNNASAHQWTTWRFREDASEFDIEDVCVFESEDLSLSLS